MRHSQQYSRKVGYFCEILLILCTSIPFFNRAFHIDDNFYLMISANLQAHPAFPQDLSSLFEGLSVESYVSHEHPLLLSSYLLAPALLGNWTSPELIAHLTYFPFLLLFWISCRVWAGELCRNAGLAALLAALSPVVFLSSHSVMLDLPYTALVLSALAVWREKRLRGRAWVWCGLLGGGAVMLAYQAVFFLPLVWWAGRQASVRERLAALVVPAAALVLYAGVNSVYFGRFIWSDLAAFYLQQPSSGGVWVRLVHSAAALAGAVVFPLGWLLLARRPLESFRDFLSRPAGSILAGIFAINLLLALLLYHDGTVRYWLPSVAPLCIFLTFVGERYSKPRWLLVPLLALTAGLSLTLGLADREWANFYRTESSLVEDYSKRGDRVFIAGEWGFRWYFQRRGAAILGRSDLRPEPGDVLIRPALASPYLTAYDPVHLSLELRRGYHPSTPFRLLETSSGAGFYSSGWGLLPYSLNFGDQPLEEILVFRITGRPEVSGEAPTYWEWNK